MFVGRFEHTLDPKGRLVLPSSFRDEMAVGGYLTQADDGCLALWTEDEFRKEAADMLEQVRTKQIDRHKLRAFSSGAAQVKPDAQGRIAIAPPLREFAALTKEVVVIGALASIEIWDAARWQTVNQVGEAALGSAGPGRAE